MRNVISERIPNSNSDQLPTKASARAGPATTGLSWADASAASYAVIDAVTADQLHYARIPVVVDTRIGHRFMNV
jgi:hypothetical protein